MPVQPNGFTGTDRVKTKAWFHMNFGYKKPCQPINQRSKNHVTKERICSAMIVHNNKYLNVHAKNSTVFTLFVFKQRAQRHSYKQEVSICTNYNKQNNVRNNHDDVNQTISCATCHLLPMVI